MKFPATKATGPNAAVDALPAYRRIAVPLDGTLESEGALRWAAAIAQRAHAALELIHVTIQPPIAPEIYGEPAPNHDLGERDRAIATARLNRLASEIRTRGIPTSATVLDGAAPIVLADHVSATGIDLVVMTTHDRGRLEHFLFGSVAESVARHGHVPVLLVRESKSDPSGELPVEIRQILVPLDGSDFAEQILPHVAALRALMQAEITLVCVLQPVLAAATSALAAGQEPSIPLGEVPDWEPGDEPGLAELERTAQALRTGTDLSVRTVVLADGQPAHAIVDYAAHHAIDLIAMATHGRGALKRLVAGSVSDGVVRSSDLPVLLLRPRM